MLKCKEEWLEEKNHQINFKSEKYLQTMTIIKLIYFVRDREIMLLKYGNFFGTKMFLFGPTHQIFLRNAV